MKELQIGDEVIPIRKDDRMYGQVGIIASTMPESNKFGVDFGDTRRLRHFNDLQKASEFMKDEAMNANYLMKLYANSVLIDTETTGVNSEAEICEISIIDRDGNTLLDTLVKPSKLIPDDVIAIHGITNEMVANAPTFAELNNTIKSILKDKDIIVYNAQYDICLLVQAAHYSGVDINDVEFYKNLAPKARCAMLIYSEWYGELGNYGSPKWHKLTAACQQQQIDISSITAHRAKADCLMTLSLIKNCKYKYGESKMKTNENQIASAINLEQLVVNTNAIIEINVDLSIQYIDSRVASFTGDSEELEAELTKWFKEFGKRRLELTNPVRDSLQQVVNDEKKIKKHLDDIFAANKAKRDAEETERKKTKRAEVMVIMADMLNAVDLPAEYLAKIVFREEYYQKGMVNKKLKDSIQEQINTQINLYNGWKAEQELKQQKIKNRELLIANLNAQYSANGAYSMFTIEAHTDEQVIAKYEANHQLKLQKEMERQSTEEQKNTQPQAHVVQSTPVNAQASQLRVARVAEPDNQTNAVPMDIFCNQEQAQNDTVTIAPSGSVKTYRFSIDASQCANFSEDDCWHNFVKRLDAFKENFAKYGVKMTFEEILND